MITHDVNERHSLVNTTESTIVCCTVSHCMATLVGIPTLENKHCYGNTLLNLVLLKNDNHYFIAFLSTTFASFLHNKLNMHGNVLGSAHGNVDNEYTY